MEERNKFPSVFLHMLKALYKKDKRAFPHSFYEIKIRSLQPENWFPTIHKSLCMPTVYCIFGTSLISSVVWFLFVEEEIHRVDSHYSLFKVINVDCYLHDYLLWCQFNPRVPRKQFTSVFWSSIHIVYFNQYLVVCLLIIAIHNYVGTIFITVTW